MIYYYKIPEDVRISGRKEETALALKVLAAALKRECGMESLPDMARDENGKPYFKDRGQLHFNYSHCKREVLCGIGKSPVGVDVEVSRVFRPGFAKHVCHPNEIKLLEQCRDKDEVLLSLWVAKEAYLKFLGKGIRCDLRETDMSGAVSGNTCISDNIFIRLWNENGIHRCACTAEKEQLDLLKIENI